MRLLRAIVSAIPVVALCLCVATTAFQAAGLAVLWWAGAVTQDKLVRYAAVIYGLDLTDLPPNSADQSNTDTSSQVMSRDAILRARVDSSPLLAARQTAVAQGTEHTQIMFQKLQSDTDRFDRLRDRFDAHLQQLEHDIRAATIQEVRQTLEILPSKQAKLLILRILQDEGLDPEDDVVEDVVTIIKGMPQDKLKRILGEFKTPLEREKLHRILVEIGDLESR